MKKIMWKMTWNQRKSIIGIFIEQIFIILILMFCTVSLFTLLKQYLAPGLLNTNNQYVIGIDPSPNASQDTKSKINKNLSTLINKLKESPYVEEVSISSNLIPYLRPENYYRKDTISINGKKIQSHLKWADKNALTTYDIHLKEGNWFSDDDQILEDGSSPVVISQQLLDSINYPISIGRKFMFQNKECTIIGIVSGIKEKTFMTSFPVIIFPINGNNSPNNETKEYTAIVKKENKKDFYEVCLKEFNKMGVNNEAELSILDIQLFQSSTSSNENLQIIAQFLPVVFLFFFAFIGTFALFWIRSRKKAKEYALMIALGTTPNQMKGYVIQESMAITLLASVPSLIIAAFIYDFTIVHVIAITTTILVMLFFAIFSAWYPAYKVSRINPAEVLHYE